MLPTNQEPAPFDHGRLVRIASVMGLLSLGLTLASLAPSGSAAAPPSASDKEPTIDGRPLFAAWPDKGKQRPDAVIVFSGQTYGHIQPCGCSRPQYGGLERRAQFIRTLKDKGWPVAGVDLGDVYAESAALREQGLLRYKTIMDSLREMGYLAVGLGKTEFSVEIDRVVAEYALQKEQRPHLLAGNLMGISNGKQIPREQRFPKLEGMTRPMIDQVEVAEVGRVSIGVAGIIGRSLAEEIEKEKLDPSVTFEKLNGKVDNAAALKQAVQALAAHPKKPQLKVLLYQGTPDDAKNLAQAWPEFNVILCRSEDPTPPQYPTVEGKTAIIYVGQKGQYVGVIGAFKKPGGGFDLHYQLVQLTEYYVTPGNDAAAIKANPILGFLQNYAEAVSQQNYLAQTPRKLHHAQNAEPKLKLHYVGSEACKACHKAEYDIWEKNTTHSHAFDTLEKVAKRPSLRHRDPECVICHTIGFEYNTGYQDEKKTSNLKHVGCENCHGPGSGHVADPKAKNLLEQLSPWKEWKSAPNVKLPAALIKQLATTPPVERGQLRVQPAQQLMINKASSICAQCHKAETDPHFDFPTYWLKIDHSGKAPPGGWPVVPPKNAAPDGMK